MRWALNWFCLSQRSVVFYYHHSLGYNVSFLFFPKHDAKCDSSSKTVDIWHDRLHINRHESPFYDGIKSERADLVLITAQWTEVKMTLLTPAAKLIPPGHSQPLWFIYTPHHSALLPSVLTALIAYNSSMWKSIGHATLPQERPDFKGFHSLNVSNCFFILFFFQRLVCEHQ